MQSSKLNRSLFVSASLFMFGCATSSYLILNQDHDSAEFSVSPDRVLLECEWITDGAEPDMYGFMIHILDDEDTVLTLNQGNVLGKEDCDSRLKNIGHILQKGRKIYVAGIGNIHKTRIKGEPYTFPKKGMFPSNGRTLQFIVIKNEYGTCYDAYSGDEKPCPRDPFPSKNIKWP